MKLDHHKDFLTGAMTFVLTVLPGEYEAARFSGADLALIEECQGDDASIADRLLALELIARRVEEAVVPSGNRATS